MSRPGVRKIYSQRYGYKIHAVGTVGSIDQRWLAVRQPSLDPEWVDPIAAQQFPPEIPWPDGDLETLLACITALYHQDNLTLSSIKAANPRHVFGFETFLGWVQSKLQAAGHTLDSPTKVVPGDEGEIRSRDILTRRDLGGGLWVEFHVVRFKSDDAWGQVLFRTRRSLLTKAWIDLINSEGTVFIHHPGRWVALGRDISIIEEVIGPYSIPMPAQTTARQTLVLAGTLHSSRRRGYAHRSVAAKI